MSPEIVTKTPPVQNGRIEEPHAELDPSAKHRSLPEEALLIYDNLPKEHRKALVRANAAIEYISEDHPEVVIHGSTEPVKNERGVHFLDVNLDGNKDIEVQHLGFEVYEEMLSGKIESAHAVLPGVLTYDVEVTNGEAENKSACRQVAIKGYSKREFGERLDRVNKEIAISRQMIQAGELGFSPVAVVITPPYFNKEGDNDTVFLLTELKDELFTLDNAQWHQGLEDESNIGLLDKAVSALARFNKTIGKHGDSKLKNFIQSSDGQVSVIDFETSEQYPSEGLATGVVAAETAEADLTLLIKSLEDTGFFKGLKPYESDIVVTRIMETYVSHWANETEELQEAVLNAAIKSGTSHQR